LAERLTIYPEFIKRGEPWLDPRLRSHVSALVDPLTGLARADAMPTGLPWQEPDGGWGVASGRTDLHTEIDASGRTNDRRDDFDSVYGDWNELRSRLDSGAVHFDSDILAALKHAADVGVVARRRRRIGGVDLAGRRRPARHGRR
jgi:FO synthase